LKPDVRRETATTSGPHHPDAPGSPTAWRKSVMHRPANSSVPRSWSTRRNGRRRQVSRPSDRSPSVGVRFEMLEEAQIREYLDADVDEVYVQQVGPQLR
jgi:hypothetical protein